MLPVDLLHPGSRTPGGRGRGDTGHAAVRRVAVVYGSTEDAAERIAARLHEGRFVGLVLGDDDEDHLTEARIERWCAVLLSRLRPPPPAAGLADR